MDVHLAPVIGSEAVGDTAGAAWLAAGCGIACVPADGGDPCVAGAGEAARSLRSRASARCWSAFTAPTGLSSAPAVSSRLSSPITRSSSTARWSWVSPAREPIAAEVPNRASASSSALAARRPSSMTSCACSRGAWRMSSTLLWWAMVKPRAEGPAVPGEAADPGERGQEDLAGHVVRVAGTAGADVPVHDGGELGPEPPEGPAAARARCLHEEVQRWFHDGRCPLSGVSGLRRAAEPWDDSSRTSCWRGRPRAALA